MRTVAVMVTESLIGYRLRISLSTEWPKDNTVSKPRNIFYQSSFKNRQK